MPDVYDRIYEELSKKLPNKEDKELLRELLNIQRKGGKEVLQTEIKSMIEKIGGEQ